MEKKVCLVTGGNSGIEEAAAVQLAEKGLTVVIGCRNSDKNDDKWTYDELCK